MDGSLSGLHIWPLQFFCIFFAKCSVMLHEDPEWSLFSGLLTNSQLKSGLWHGCFGVLMLFFSHSSSFGFMPGFIVLLGSKSLPILLVSPRCFPSEFPSFAAFIALSYAFLGLTQRSVSLAWCCHHRDPQWGRCVSDAAQCVAYTHYVQSDGQKLDFDLIRLQKLLQLVSESPTCFLENSSWDVLWHF